MQVQEFPVQGPKLLTPKKFGDSRGYFSETYNRKTLEAAGIHCEFVQDNQSLSAQKGTVRGLHFQTSPCAQDKLVRVTKGRIFDVAVDVRKSSPTYGRHIAVELSAANWAQLFVPIGFAHAFMTLDPDTEVFYKVSGYYAPAHDAGIFWNDPSLGIAWPLPASDVLLSDKDARLPRLNDIAPPF